MTDLEWCGCSGAGRGRWGWGTSHSAFHLALSLWGYCSGAGAVPSRQLRQSSPLTLALRFSFPFCSPGPRKGQGILCQGPGICSLPGAWEHSFLVSLGSSWVTPHPSSGSPPSRDCRSFNSAASCVSPPNCLCHSHCSCTFCLPSTNMSSKS